MKMYLKIILSTLMISILAGCSSGKPTLSNYEKPATMIALAEVCKSKGLVSEASGTEFQQFTMEMVKKTNYDKQKLSKLYYERLNGADKEIAKKNIDIKKLCRQVSNEVGIEKQRRIQYKIRQQQSIMANRRAIASLSRSLNSISSLNAPTTYNSYKFPLPALQSRKRGFTPMYNSNQCAGRVVNGKCYGAAIGVPTKNCYGIVILGKCHGSGGSL